MIIGVVNCGIGNVQSVVNVLKKINYQSLAISTPDGLDGVDAIILPGIGNFDSFVLRLKQQGFWDKLKQVIRSEQPLIGICVGAQVLCLSSDDGSQAGLGVFDVRCKKIPQSNIEPIVKVPHMGWNTISSKPGTPKRKVLDNRFGIERFYFAHSFAIPISDETVMTSKHGVEFSACLKKKNIFAIQFHQEKSHVFGMNFLDSIIQDISKDSSK